MRVERPLTTPSVQNCRNVMRNGASHAARISEVRPSKSRPKSRPFRFESEAPNVVQRGMEKTIRKYTDFEEMKADEYRYWQSRPVHERIDAVEEMIQTAYALKGWEMEPNVPRLQRPFVRLPCPWR